MQDVSYLTTATIACPSLEQAQQLLRSLAGTDCSVIVGFEHRCLALAEDSSTLLGPVQYHVTRDEDTISLWLTFHPASDSCMLARLTKLAAGCNATLTVLTDQLCRFRLLGPTSTQMLQQLFSLVDTDAANTELWAALGNATNPGELQAGAMMALTVWDPRLKSMEELSELKSGELVEHPATTAAGSSRHQSQRLLEVGL